MGKYIRKCKGIGEIAVMEVAQVGVRTRARALAMETASLGAAKRRKVGDGELKLSPSLIQLATENSVSPVTSMNSRRRSDVNERSLSPSSDHVPASCCSSNGSSELSKETSNFVDLEEESVEIATSTYIFNCRERRSEMTPSIELQAESGDLESTARPTEAISRRRSSAAKMPSESEIEQFFAEAEKDIQKQFTEKYNFDIVKDVPLKGRYEWKQQSY